MPHRPARPAGSVPSSHVAGQPVDEHVQAELEPGVPAAGVVLLAVLVPAVALLASAVPVRRAARLRPAPALRAE